MIYEAPDLSFMSDIELILMRSQSKDDPNFRRAVDMEMKKRAEQPSRESAE